MVLDEGLLLCPKPPRDIGSGYPRIFPDIGMKAFHPMGALLGSRRRMGVGKEERAFSGNKLSDCRRTQS